MKSIAIVLHKYLPQPDDDLVIYLNKKREFKIAHIFHSIPEASDRRSSYKEYINGRVVKTKVSSDYRFFPEPLVLLKNMFYSFIWLAFSGGKWDVYVGMDGLSTSVGLLLKNLGKVNKVIYWSIDFVPVKRFGTAWKNFFYRKVNIIACKDADEVWDLSPRMVEGRSKYLRIREKDYKYRRVVPYGLWIDRIKKIPYTRCQKNTIVFMGHLLPKQGVDMFIRKISQIVKKIPDFKFRIIGSGSFEQNLIDLANKLSVKEYCEFLGRIEDSKEMEKKIAECAVAVAPYKKMKDNYSYYADPGKVKTYLACGVPVLLTDLPWNADDIVRKKCGLIIKDDGSDLVEMLLKIMKPFVNKEFRKNAVKYSKNFDYKKIFSKLEL